MTAHRNPGLIGAASSVIVATGEFRWAATDLALKDRWLSMIFTRSYRSGYTDVGALGRGWQHLFEQRLTVAASTVTYHDGRTNTLDFTVIAGGYGSPPGCYSSLTYDASSDEFSLLQRGRVRLLFANYGQGTYRLRSLVTPSFRSIELAYDAAGDLRTLVDYRGRALTLDYSPAHLLESVNDGSGREVHFEYAAGNLIAVRGPATAQFPQGCPIGYDYAGGRLVGMRDALDRLYLANTYDPGGRVVAQRFGETTQVLQFAYASGVTTETDRGGNVTEYEYSVLGQITRKTLHTRGLRPTDPPTYVTEYEYGANLERTLVRFPSGQELSWSYDESNPDPCARGNMLAIIRTPAITGAPIQQAVVYEPLLGVTETFPV